MATGTINTLQIEAEKAISENFPSSCDVKKLLFSKFHEFQGLRDSTWEQSVLNSGQLANEYSSFVSFDGNPSFFRRSRNSENDYSMRSRIHSVQIKNHLKHTKSRVCGDTGMRLLKVAPPKSIVFIGSVFLRDIPRWHLFNDRGYDNHPTARTGLSPLFLSRLCVTKNFNRLICTFETLWNVWAALRNDQPWSNTKF